MEEKIVEIMDEINDTLSIGESVTGPQAKAITAHVMSWVRDIYENGFFVIENSDCTARPFDEQYQCWLTNVKK